MNMTKKDFYRQRAETYLPEDPEAAIRYQRAVAWVDFRPGLVVREIGCKYAVLLSLLKENTTSYDYIGVDIDASTLQKIPGYNTKEFRVYDANQGLPFNDESVDYFFSLEIIEHLENATQFFENVFRILKPSGKLILSVPNPHCWMEIYVNLRKFHDREGHIASYSWQNIDAITKFAGLKILDTKGTFTRFPFTRRMLGRYRLFETDSFFLTRSFLYLIGKSDDNK